MKEINQEMKDAYKKAVSLNNFSLKTLSKLHKRTEVAIEKYLFAKGRYPDFQCCYELYWMIKNINGLMPQELARLISRSSNRANSSAKAIGKSLDRDRFEYVGETLIEKTAYYFYKGEEMTLTQISKKIGVSYTLVKKRLIEVAPGTDVSNIDFSLKKRGPKSGANPKNNSLQ